MEQLRRMEEECLLLKSRIADYEVTLLAIEVCLLLESMPPVAANSLSVSSRSQSGLLQRVSSPAAE